MKNAWMLAAMAGAAFGQSTPYTSAWIATCVGAFGAAGGPCTVRASSGGAPISASGAVSTSGESVTYLASGSAQPGALRGSVSTESTTMNPAGPGVMVDAVEQLVDLVTVQFQPFAGRRGFIILRYRLQGENRATGTNAVGTSGRPTPYGCVKMGIHTPIFPFGCTGHFEAAVNGTFAKGPFQFTFGEQFPMWFQLESIAGTGFGPGRPTGAGSSSAEFANTAEIGSVSIFDENMNPLGVTPTIASELGIAYTVEGAAPVPAVSPALLAALAAALAWLAARRLRAIQRPE